jgi:hypothetical protein
MPSSSTGNPDFWLAQTLLAFALFDFADHHCVAVPQKPKKITDERLGQLQKKFGKDANQQGPDEDLDGDFKNPADITSADSSEDETSAVNTDQEDEEVPSDASFGFDDDFDPKGKGSTTVEKPGSSTRFDKEDPAVNELADSLTRLASQEEKGSKRGTGRNSTE